VEASAPAQPSILAQHQPGARALEGLPAPAGGDNGALQPAARNLRVNPSSGVAALGAKHEPDGCSTDAGVHPTAARRRIQRKKVRVNPKHTAVSSVLAARISGIRISRRGHLPGSS